MNKGLSSGRKRMRKIITASNILFVILMAVFLLSAKDGKTYWTLAAFTAATKLLQLAVRFLVKGEKYKTSTDDVLAIFYVVFGGWHLLSARFDVLSKMLFPEPEIVFSMFVSELPDMFKGLVNSVILLAGGYLLALVTAIPLGIYVGWHGRLYRAVNPYAQVLGPIPPIVYIPYAITLLPTFRAASIFVIFLGAFWPLFINTVHGVFNIPQKLIDSAKVLNLGKWTLFTRIILFGAMPSICVGAHLALLFSFLMLTAAELIGANSGVGWYIRNFGDFGDYPRVIAGLIFIGLVVTAITFGTAKIERHLLKWTDAKK